MLFCGAKDIVGVTLPALEAQNEGQIRIII